MTGVPSPFGPLLRRYRSAAGLTQEELAERAEISVRAVSDLERGVNSAPRPYTVRRLADALDLSPEDRALFHRTASGGPDVPVPLAGAPPHGRFLGALPEWELIGREQEMARVDVILDSVAGGSGHTLLLSGEAGSGKTRLLQEATLHARKRGFLILTGACVPADLHQAYHPLLAAFDPSRSGISATTPVLEAVSTAFKELTTGIGADQRVVSALADGLTRSSQASPVALLLDDLQWADAHTLSVLHALARLTRTSRTLLLGAFSDVELAESSPALSATIRSLSRERLVAYLAVKRLSGEETTALVSALMSYDDVSEEFAGFVYRRTKGSPRLIDELVRSLGGRLDLESEIGAGSMGRVFRAYDRVTGRTVAAKLVLARAGIGLDELLRFQQEGEILRSLDHPNIVRIHDSFAEEHVACIVMELLEGRSLARELDNGPLELSRAKSIALQTVEALSYAHAQGVVHRDVKPDNIMLLDGDRVKVTDFGVARILSVDTKMGTIATTGMRVGTPLYMAPEQIEGKRVDARTDVYGFGASLYHMVAGRPPFEGDDALAIAVQQMKEEPPPPSSRRSGLPREWDEVILKALAKDPRRRFRSASEMKSAIEGLGTHAAERSARPKQAKRFAVAGAALLVVALLASMLGYSAAAGNGGGVTLSSYLAGAAAMGQLSGTVLVARHGKVLLDRGYGYADLATHRPNDANTEYGLANATTTALLVADVIQGTQAEPGIDPANGLGPTALNRPICDLSSFTGISGVKCPGSGVSVADLVEGTAGLPNIPRGSEGRQHPDCGKQMPGAAHAEADPSSCLLLDLRRRPYGRPRPDPIQPEPGGPRRGLAAHWHNPGGRGPIRFRRSSLTLWRISSTTALTVRQA